LRDTLAPAQLGDTVLAALPIQYDPDFVLGGILLPSGSANILNNTLGGGFLA
jgi:hypothetical protein